MSFNSIKYIFFLFVSVVIYYLVGEKYRKIWLLASSVIFYLFWGIKAFLLIVIVSAVTFLTALVFNRYKDKNLKRAKVFIYTGMVLNIGTLCFFKLFSPFVCAGISFCVFRNLAYLADIKNGKFEPEKRLLNFALFSLFFAYIVQGPIERADNILPQFDCNMPFSWSNIRDGLTLIIWGLFKKVLIADNLALVVNSVYKNPLDFSGIDVLFSSFCYSILIYCDFSGYSDIAIGSAKLLGYKLKRNFNAPYLAVSIREFWKRWHISLSTWLMDYIYIPLGGSKRGIARKYLNLIIVFLVSGLWHGNGLTFIVWGLIHALLQIIENTAESKIEFLKEQKHRYPYRIVRIIVCFLCVNFSWIFFRADSISSALTIIKRMLMITREGFSFNIHSFGINPQVLIICLAAFILVTLIDIVSQKISVLNLINNTVWLRYAVYTLLILSILMFGYYGPSFDPMDFVYFKF